MKEHKTKITCEKRKKIYVKKEIINTIYLKIKTH